MQQRAEEHKPSYVAGVQLAGSSATTDSICRMMHDFLATVRMLHDDAQRQQNRASANAYHSYGYSRRKGLAD